jgi:ADP-dependent NAD(P)H-hydrate dehydratase / NAD(P)H-hydrate epimerase
VVDAVLTSREVAELEKAAFADGVDAESLMDRAAEGIARVVCEQEPRPGLCLLYLGKGNNAGDAIVAGSLLAKAGWQVWTRFLTADQELHPLPKKKLAGLDARRFTAPIEELPRDRPRVILDGLLGLGSRAELGPPLKALTREINALRIRCNASVYAVDLPTGVGEEGVDPDAVTADFTVTISFPKTLLFRDDATNFVGRIILVELPELAVRLSQDPERAILTCPANLKEFVPRRPFDSHKGNFGRIGIVAGSRGFVGAAIMCAEAAARAGGGLISLYVPEEIYNLVVCKITPEIMVKPIRDFGQVLGERVDAFGVGPGMGSTDRQKILDLISQFSGPMVVDADGLNALSTAVSTLHDCVGPRLLTPHPGEMSRLWHTAGKSRLEIVKEFTAEYQLALLLKGARTLVGQNGKPVAYNSTGSPGLATGGSGDVLTGTCAAFLGRGISPYDAGRLGAWLCGRAAELAVSRSSEEAMLPSDLYQYFGDAFGEIRNG